MREYRILHLEDSQSDADIVKRQLQKGNLNFQYLFVDDEESYKRGLSDFKPDVILCDHALPQFDSIMAFDIYKELKFEIPFILVTGSVSEEYAVEMIKKGIDDYLLKTNLHRLPQAIKSAFSRRENEIKIRLAEKELKQSEINLRTIFENTASGFLLLDVNLRIVSFNNQINHFAKNSFGFDLQVNSDLISMFASERQKEFKNLFSIVLDGNAINYEISYPQTNGKFIWYSINGKPIRNLEGSVSGLCLTIDNITERKKAEQAKTEYVEGLVSMIFMTSHKVRQPIANILGLASLLDASMDSQEELKKIVDYMKQAALRLDECTHELNHFIHDTKDKVEN